VVAVSLNNKRLTVGILDFEPLTHVPEHRHDNEQLGLAVKGSITMVIDGQRRELRVARCTRLEAGFLIPGNQGRTAPRL